MRKVKPPNHAINQFTYYYRLTCYVCNKEFEIPPNSRRILCDKCIEKRDKLIIHNKRSFEKSPCLKCGKYFERHIHTEIFCNTCNTAIHRIDLYKINLHKNNDEERKILFFQNNGRCEYCDKKLSLKYSQKDHIVPVSKNGSDEIENKVISCRRCNLVKSNRSEKEFKKYLKYRQQKSLENYVYFTNILNNFNKNKSI